LAYASMTTAVTTYALVALAIVPNYGSDEKLDLCRRYVRWRARGLWQD
jgi:hypothetical protein